MQPCVLSARMLPLCVSVCAAQPAVVCYTMHSAGPSIGSSIRPVTYCSGEWYRGDLHTCGMLCLLMIWTLLTAAVIGCACAGNEVMAARPSALLADLLPW